MKRIFALGAFVVLAVLSSKTASAHCQIPCGIYGDQMRFDMMLEDLKTVEKSMSSLANLAKEKTKNHNQIVRWVQNKEDHANKIQDTVTQYFLAQRIKYPAAKNKAAMDKYYQQLSLLHRIHVAAMKMKQTADAKHVQEARKLVDEFHKSYFGKP